MRGPRRTQVETTQVQGAQGSVTEGNLATAGAVVRRSLRLLGRRGERVIAHAGGIGTLAWSIAVYLAQGRVSFREVMVRAYDMGVQSLPIVMITAVLAGVVTTQQGGYQFTGAVPLYVLGSVVVSSMVLELGPVLTAIVLVGRVGARITAELGTMKVSEQIDAFHALGRDPVRVLAAPRVLAGIVVVPILVAIANVVGIYAGMIAAELTLGLGRASFFYGARLFWHRWDLLYSLAKGAAFGFAIPLIAVYMGLSTRGGAEGVGRTTTHSVVFMTLTILVLDALFPPLLLN